MATNNGPGTILVAEDDDDDFNLTERAFRKLSLPKKIVRVKNGQELIDYLRNGKSPRPDLILLDLNMPIKDGRETLQEIRADGSLKDIPVVVLTTSRSEEDVARTYKLGVNSFIRKPFRQEEFVGMIQALSRYWFDFVELPPHDEKNERKSDG